MRSLIRLAQWLGIIGALLIACSCGAAVVTWFEDPWMDTDGGTAPNNLSAQADLTWDYWYSSTWNPEKLRDGGIGWARADYTGGNSHSSYGFWLENTSWWNWDEPKAIGSVNLFVLPAATVVPTAVSVYAKDENDNYAVQLYHSTSAAWTSEQPAGYALRISGGEPPIVTKGISVRYGHNSSWTELGEVQILGVDGQPDTAAPWSMTMCRNDTEQAVIGLMNTGGSSVDVTVSVSSNLPSSKSNIEMLVMGAMVARLDTPLMNLFTEDQVASFEGDFPVSFTDTDLWKDFPTLHLAPNKAVRIWLRVRTFPTVDSMTYASAGQYQINFSAVGDGVNVSKTIDVEVLPVTLPSKPVVESQPYGGLTDENSKLHHTTVNHGYKNYVIGHFLTFSGLYGQNLYEIYMNDPDDFNSLIALKVDQFLAKYLAMGYPKDRILFELQDEPNDTSGRETSNFIVAAKSIRLHDPTVKITANPGITYSNISVTLNGCFRPLSTYVDVWVPHAGNLTDAGIVNFLIREMGKGKQVWFYQDVGLGTARVETAAFGWYRTTPWYALKYDLDGVGFWSATSCYGDCWNDFDSWLSYDWQDAALVFPSSAGPIDTKNWEAWREAIEDISIMRMLKYAKEHNMIEDPADAATANTLLTTGIDDVMANNFSSGGQTVKNTIASALDILSRNWSDCTPLQDYVVPDMYTNAVKYNLKNTCVLTSDNQYLPDWGAKKLRDGFIGSTRDLVASGDVTDEGGDFKYGARTVWTWPELKWINNIQFLNESAPSAGFPTTHPTKCIAVYATDSETGQQKKIYWNDNVTWTPTGNDNVVELRLTDLNIVTKRLTIVFAEPDSWARLGEVNIWGDRAERARL